MNIFKMTWRTVVYYLIPCLFWNFLFWRFFNIRLLCLYADQVLLLKVEYVYLFLLGFFLLLIAGHRTIKLYAVFVNIHRVKAHINEVYSYKYSVGYDGEQDVGKTFSMTYDGIVLSEKQYSDLLFDYYIDYPVKDKLKEDAENGVNTLKWEIYKAKQDAVEYYSSHPDKIPCLYSNNKVKMHGLESYDLKKEHFSQELRMPENATVLFDEAANDFGNTVPRPTSPILFRHYEKGISFDMPFLFLCLCGV